jgi:hypothetical protein
MALDGKTAAAPEGVPAAEPAREQGVPALFARGDFDGDGRSDLAAVSLEGTLHLLTNAGDGSFDDVTERSGLAGVEGVAVALWADYDADGRQDLFVGARAGASRLYRNEAGTFLDMTAGSGRISWTVPAPTTRPGRRSQGRALDGVPSAKPASRSSPGSAACSTSGASTAGRTSAPPRETD